MQASLFPPSSTSSIEFELRRQFLRVALLTISAVILAYFLLASLTPLRPLYFPIDALLMGALLVVLWALYRRATPSSVANASSWLVAATGILAGFYSQTYGIASPATALFLPSILLAGLLVGGWFLPMWTLLICTMVGLWGWLELQGMVVEAAQPVATSAEFVQLALFWWLLFGVSAWLIWQFASTLERAIHTSRGQAQALARALSGLASDPRVDTVLRQAVVSVAAQLDTDWVVVYLHDRDRDLLTARMVHSPDGILTPNATAERTIPPTPAAEVPIFEELRRTREPLIIDDVANDPRLRYREQVQRDGIVTILAVPLLMENEAIGFFGVHTTTPRRYTRTELAVAQALAQQVTLAMQFGRLTEQLRDSAVVDERNRMAREIHDTLAQGFTGILIQLEAAEDSIEMGNSAEALPHLNRARSLARDSLSEARRSVWALRPSLLDQQTLPSALENLTARLTAATPIVATFRTEGTPRELGSQTDADLLRIAQEALNNVVKHSQATHVEVVLATSAESCTLRIQDDGVGLDLGRDTSGFGLTSMHERAQRLDGTLTIDPNPSGGTIVQCRLPLPATTEPSHE